MSGEFETTIIFKPDLAQESYEKIFKKIEKVFTDNKVKVVHNKDWGRRKLAYRVQKLSYGRYHFYSYQSDQNIVPALERVLNLEENILRHLSVKTVDDIHHESKNKVVRITELEDFEFGEQFEFTPRNDRRRPYQSSRPQGQKFEGEQKSQAEESRSEA